AGEFMGKALHRALIETDQLQELAGALPRRVRIDAMRDRAVGDDMADLAARIERGERIRKDHLDAAALPAQLFAMGLREIDIAHAHRTLVGFDEPHDEPRYG